MGYTIYLLARLTDFPNPNPDPNPNRHGPNPNRHGH